ncbi:hypothetical protein AGMMS4952_18920 [Spirochaetia bacterium]|nr:hypothetical protein AGMMS4952_18920 [Spirochaetia bacterium]
MFRCWLSSIFCDHCGKKVSVLVRALLLLVPGMLTLLGVTNDLHHRLIVRYWFPDESVHQLDITPGILDCIFVTVHGVSNSL